MRISHTFLSKLFDFAAVVDPADFLLAERVYDYIASLDASLSLPYPAPVLSVKADYLFFSARPFFEVLLMSSPPDRSPRGYLLEALRIIYFREIPSKSEVHLVTPHHPVVSEVLDCAAFRFYAPENFRRRLPRNWKPEPPLYSGFNKEDYRIIFRTTGDDRHIFHWHPQADIFSHLFLYLLLQGVELSWIPIPCRLSALEPKLEEALMMTRRGFRSFLYPKGEKPPIYSRYTLLPPAHIPSWATGQLINVPIPPGVLLNICLSHDLFRPSSLWCWCLTETGQEGHSPETR
ncbi:MAG: hypothetical protein AB1330_09535 [Bacillota bacterium]